MSIATQNDTKAAIDWYRANEVYPGQLDFDPDGMCLRICREARNILPGAPSALASALSTPKQYRVTKIADVRRGMVGYFDDPNDSNPYGHIVTWVARRAGYDPNTLASLLCRTNSVKSNQIVVVPGDYFERYWGDGYQFSATWLNGEPFYDLQPKPVKPPKPTRSTRVEKSLENLTETARLLRRAAAAQTEAGNTRFARVLVRDLSRTVALRDKLREQYRAEKRLSVEGG